MISGFVRFHQLNADHQAQTTHVADYRVALLQLAQFAFQPFALCSNFVSDVVIFQQFQRSQAGRHCELVATEGAGVVARRPGVELFLNAQYRQWQTAADRF